MICLEGKSMNYVKRKKKKMIVARPASDAAAVDDAALIPAICDQLRWSGQ